MQSHPHHVDATALLRMAVVYNLPIACNHCTADFMISFSPMAFCSDGVVKGNDDYIHRPLGEPADQAVSN